MGLKNIILPNKRMMSILIRVCNNLRNVAKIKEQIDSALNVLCKFDYSLL